LIGHIRAQDKTGKLILIAHGALQILIGTSVNFLNMLFRQYQYFNCPTWLTTVWKFLDGLQITVDIAQGWLPLPPLGGDLNLMDYFSTKSFTIQALQSINRCRVYLQLLYLSDMASADGKRLIPQVFQGQRLVDRRSLLNWPEQQKPSTLDWSIWSNAFQHLVRGDILLHPLDMSVCHPQQQFVWCIATQNTLFESLGGNSWRRFTLAPRGDSTRNGILKFDKSTAQACDPPHFPRYSASLHGSSSRLLLAIQGGEQHHSTTVSPPVNEKALEAQVGSVQHPYYSFLFHNLTVTMEEQL